MADKLYVSMTTKCDASSSAYPAVLYSSSRSAPLISRCSDYNSAIQRFAATGMRLPLHIAPLRTTGSYSNGDTVYAVRVTVIRTGINTFAKRTALYYVNWTPQLTGGAAVATIVNGATSADNEALWVMTYDAMVGAIDRAIANAYADVRNTAPVANNPLRATCPALTIESNAAPPVFGLSIDTAFSPLGRQTRFGLETWTLEFNAPLAAPARPPGRSGIS